MNDQESLEDMLEDVKKALDNIHVVHPHPLEVATLKVYLKGIANVKVVGQDIVID